MSGGDRISRTVSVPRSAASPADIDAVSRSRVLFGHQSVGRNILDALPAVAARVDVEPVPVSVYRSGAALEPGLTEFAVGRNGDPLGKIAEFAAAVREASAHGGVDLALVKLCFADFDDPAVSPDEVFAVYRRTLSELETTLPDTIVVPATVPLVTDRTLRDRVGNLLGRSAHRRPDSNVRREAFNRAVRTEYAASGRLFDIASLMAAGPTGRRAVRRHRGAEYFAMDRRLASDPGHLNSDGAELIGSAFLATLARAGDDPR